MGAVFVARGPGCDLSAGLVGKVIVPALIAPVLAFVVGGVAILVAYRILGALRPGPVTTGFKLGQLISGGLLALAHGTNDAQKTMGIITLALIANGNISADDFHVPTGSSSPPRRAIALGTYTGGWRIIKTMGSRIIKMDTAQGFAAQGAGAAVILAAIALRLPLSTTQVITGGVMGAGAAKRVSAVRWGVAGNIVIAWVLTLPAAGGIGAIVYGVTQLFGTGAAGPLVVSVLLVLVTAGVLVRRLQQGSPITARGMIAAQVVDWGTIGKVILAALVAGLAVTAASRSRSSARSARSRCGAPGARSRRAPSPCSGSWAWRCAWPGRRWRHRRHDDEVALVRPPGAGAPAPPRRTRRPPRRARGRAGQLAHHHAIARAQVARALRGPVAPRDERRVAARCHRPGRARPASPPACPRARWPARRPVQPAASSMLERRERPGRVVCGGEALVEAPRILGKPQSSARRAGPRAAL